MFAVRRSCLYPPPSWSLLARTSACRGHLGPLAGGELCRREDDEFIGGLVEESKADKWNDMNDPITQSLLSSVLETTKEEFERAVGSAKAFESWRRASVLTRQKFALE